MSETLSAAIKRSMRISNDSTDDEIQSNIRACLLDLKRVGVHSYYLKEEPKDELVRKACELYCKYQNDYEGQADRYQKLYESLRDALSLTKEYRNEPKE